MKHKQASVLLKEETYNKIKRIGEIRSRTFEEILRSYIALGLRNDRAWLEDDCDYEEHVINRHRRMRKEMGYE